MDVSATARRMAVRVGNSYQTIALSAEKAGELGLAVDRGGPVDRIMNRNPEYFELAGAPSPFEGSPEVLLKKPDFEVHEVSRDDTEQDERSTDEIARLLAKAAGMFAEKPYGANVTHRR